MNYFFDTEFIEHKNGIDLVSIGIIDENDRTFYAESTSYNPELADDFVKENVLPRLFFSNEAPFFMSDHRGIEMKGTDKEIGLAILQFVTSADPVFFAYYASYDWVLFARLFGRLIDKPAHFPMWVVDLKQMMWERKLSKEWKREVCPDNINSHNALSDAMWNRDLYNAIIGR